jgi:hypothetical protein
LEKELMSGQGRDESKGSQERESQDRALDESTRNKAAHHQLRDAAREDKARPPGPRGEGDSR